MAKTLRTISSLDQNDLINKQDIPLLEEITFNFSTAITQEMLTLIDKSTLNDPIAKQFIPTIDEAIINPIELIDPVGDEKHTKVRGIVHRHSDRCLFKPVTVCPVYCRFCFRKEKVGRASETLSHADIETAFNYIENHPEIWEVIFTGGDPFILKPATLKKYIARLNAIPHVEIIRIHTRVPVVDSARVNNEMVRALKSAKPIYVLLHANHPNEFTPEAIVACKNLIDAGLPMLSQSVLLKDVNDTLETLSELMRCFVRNRIKPYYLHHCDLAVGTSHFRTSIAAGMALMKQLRARFSGLCQPTYVLDIPGGFGKVPLNADYLQNNSTIADCQGNLHPYPLF